MRVKGRDIMKKLISLISFVIVLVMLTSGATVFGAKENFKDFDYPAQYGWDGYPDGSFHPDELISRAEFVCYLYKLHETLREDEIDIKPIRVYNNSFSDVSPKNWYYKYVVWAYERGIINGVGNGNFDAKSTINVFDYALMMKRFYDSAFTEDWEDRSGMCLYDQMAIGCGYDDNWVGASNYDLDNDKDRETAINRVSQSDIPGWFTRETSLNYIIGLDIWIGGHGKVIDISKFSPTRGEIYKHSPVYFIGVRSPS